MMERLLGRGQEHVLRPPTARRNSCQFHPTRPAPRRNRDAPIAAVMVICRLERSPASRKAEDDHLGGRRVDEATSGLAFLVDGEVVAVRRWSLPRR